VIAHLDDGRDGADRHTVRNGLICRGEDGREC
jgi:hypothetical protein